MDSSIFLVNKYTKWYFNIIEIANNRILPNNTYTEKHHIIPRSLLGTNEKSNIAILTAREHFVCHLLLTKMTTGLANQKMYSAVSLMAKTNTQKYKVSARLYQLLRENLSKTMRLYFRHSSETKQKMSISRQGPNNANFGNYWSQEQKQQMSAIKTGTKQSEESKQRRRDSYKKESHSMFGKTHSDLAKEKMRQAKLGKSKPRFICPSCSASIGGHSNFNRHAKTCKMIPSS